MFARDPLGRRSLLIHIPTVINPYLLISSTSAGKEGYTLQEVDPGHIYSLCIDLFPLLVKVQKKIFFHLHIHMICRI